MVDTRIPRRGRLYGYAVAALAALLIGAMALSAALGPGGEDFEEATFIAGEPEEITSTLPASGAIKAATATDVTASASGPVAELAVKVGDHVERDQVLARIDVSDKEAELNNAQKAADREAASAARAVADAEAQLAQFQDLANRGLDPELRSADQAWRQAANELAWTEQQLQAGYDPELDQQAAAQRQALADADAALAAARVSANQRQAELARAVTDARGAAADQAANAEQTLGGLRKEVDGATLRAPHDGVVTAVGGQVGQAPTGAVVSVADDSTFQIDTEVKENYLEQLSVGDEVEFTSPSARGATFTGTIKSIAPVAAAAPTEDGQPGPAQGAGRASFPVTVEVTGSTEGLHIGSTARLSIVTQRATAIAVPLEAIDESGDTPTVTVVHEGGYEERAVTIEIKDELNAGVSGIEPGEEILLPGAAGGAEGDIVYNEDGSGGSVTL